MEVICNGQYTEHEVCRLCGEVVPIEQLNKRGVCEDCVGYSKLDWLLTVIYFGGECAYCGKTMRKNERLTRDHIVPVSRYGKTSIDNIIPACTACNASKGNAEWREWFMEQPFFSQERMNRIFKWRSIINAAGGDTHG